MQFKIPKSISIWLLAGAVSVLSISASAQDQSGFRTEDEGNWYHSLDLEDWVEYGADAVVVENIINKIANAQGDRRNEDQPDTLIEFGPGNWTYEWSKAGDAALLMAKTSSSKFDMYKHAKAAVLYFRIASAPHFGEQEQIAAMKKASEAYLLHNEVLPYELTKIDIAHEGKTFGAYLHLPEGEGPFPAIVASGGADEAKEELLGFFTDHLAPSGIAMISVDVPGMGDSAAFNMGDGHADKMLVATVDWAENQEMLDGKNIFVFGDSLGGTAAIQVFAKSDEVDVAGVIFACGPIDAALTAPPEAYEQLPDITTDSMKTRMGLPLDASFEQFAETIQNMALSSHGLLEGGKISTPILAIITNDDPVIPVEDLDKMLERAENPTRIVLDEPGHCPSEDILEMMTPQWVKMNLR